MVVGKSECATTSASLKGCEYCSYSVFLRFNDLPLKQWLLFIYPMHMEQYGNIVPIMVLISHFWKLLFFTRSGSEVAILAYGHKGPFTVRSCRPGWNSVRPRRVDSRRLAISYIESVPSSEFGTTTDIRQTPGMDMWLVSVLLSSANSCPSRLPVWTSALQKSCRSCILIGFPKPPQSLH